MSLVASVIIQSVSAINLSAAKSMWDPGVGHGRNHAPDHALGTCLMLEVHIDCSAKGHSDPLSHTLLTPNMPSAEPSPKPYADAIHKISASLDPGGRVYMCVCVVGGGGG